MNRIPVQSERELRELLKEVVLELYGLDTSPPTLGPEPVISKSRRKSPEKGFSRATFSSGTAPRPGRFQSEGSPLPGRRKITVGKSVRVTGGPQRRPVGTSPTGRLPGESDRDYLARRKEIRRMRAIGYAPPKDDKATSREMHWEMGH